PPMGSVSKLLLQPYGLMVAYSFWSASSAHNIVHSLSFANYAELLSHRVYRQTLLRSAWIAARVTVLSLLLGYPLAYLLSFHAVRKKNVLYQLVIIPLWVSYLVRAYAWKTILGTDGLLNTVLQFAHLANHP